MTDPIAYSPLLVIALAALATYASRALGTVLSGKISAESAVIDWITCVTYALLAGLVVRMIVLPIGALADTPDGVRLGAAAAGLAVFWFTNKSIGYGVLAGSMVLMGLSTWLS